MMTIELISLKDFRDILKTFQSLNIRFNPRLDEISYVINGELCFDKQKVLEGFSGIKQVKALRRFQLEKAIGFRDKSFLPDYKIDGEEYFELHSVRAYLAANNPGCDISEINGKINDVL